MAARRGLRLVTLGETMAMLGSVHPGPPQHNRDFHLTIAGSESNVAIGCRRLGLASTWFGRVGNDQFGELILRELRGEGVDAAAEIDSSPTGLMMKLQRTADFSEVIYYRRESAGSHLAPSDLNEDLITSASVLHITGITPALSDSAAETVWCAVEIAENAGVPISFDLNYRSTLWPADVAAPILTALTRKSSIVFAGVDEAAMVTDSNSPTEAVTRLADLGPAQVIVKLGHLGSVSIVDGSQYKSEARSVRPVDVVGAGDAFASGYLSEFVAGHPPEVRVRTATDVAAFVVSTRGDWEGLPTRAEVSRVRVVDPVIR